HADHAGGLKQLLDSGVRIGRILLPKGAPESASRASALLLEEAASAGIPVMEVAAGDRFASGRVSLEVLWPGADGVYPGTDPNDTSLVMLWDLGGTSMLTTGDVGAGYAKYAYRPAQVMKIPHHGSKAEAVPENLRLVSPGLALISASSSRPDRYSACAEILRGMGVSARVTGEAGALTLRVLDAGFELTAHAESVY
ncbi:MAG TPA: hypothetical protein VLA21_08705, partial [Candidatus Limnocylindria bacterium]|nr:hypothetical protein [Candidatus Limnocylindria bacterium]